jgi:hypothetical protein
MFAGKFQLEQTPKKLYIKSDFIPETMCTYAEGRLSQFINTLQHVKQHNQQNSKPSTNLTFLQQQHIKFLRRNKEFIILDADKNLGPTIMEREYYINRVLQEHLLNPPTYSQLQEEEAYTQIANTKTILNSILKKYEKSILPAEQKYFARSAMKPTRIPQFYGLPKIRKNKQPMPF